MTYAFAYRRYSLPFRQPVRTAHGVWTQREGVLIRLATEQGRVGYGEAAPIAWFGTETVDDVEAVCRSWEEKLTSDDVAQLPASFGCLRFALASARAATQERAGSRAAEYLPLAGLLPAGRAALEKVELLLEAGFRVFKWKVGVGDARDEWSLMDDLLAKFPTGAKLRLDANGAWDRRRAEQWLDRCAERPIEFVEQPIAPEAKTSEDCLLGLAADYPTPIALDESIATGAQVERWQDLGWRGVWVLKPALVGDLNHTLSRLEKAKADVVFSSALETLVAAKSALYSAFHYSGKPRALGFGVWPLFQDRRFDGPAAAPFIRWSDVEALNSEAAWNALS